MHARHLAPLLVDPLSDTAVLSAAKRDPAGFINEVAVFRKQSLAPVRPTAPALETRKPRTGSAAHSLLVSLLPQLIGAFFLTLGCSIVVAFIQESS